jgi:hypothetical protein
MPLNEPALSGPGAGRAVTYGGGSSAELKLAGERSGGDPGRFGIVVDQRAPVM